jgi:cellulose synthase/poly-beta-1,6-N-acetylglucosamine synthase-like glycosyltransferase
MISQILFWGSIGLILYAYVGFPLLLVLRGFLRKRPVKEADFKPNISFVITAYNEGKSIGDKLDNVLSLDYPKQKMQVIVASDGSSDQTNEIVAGYEEQGVELLAFPRQGKIPTLNAAVSYTRGEILVFSDANSMYTSDALRHLLAPFADPKVGAVGGNQCYTPHLGENTASFGERIYWNYDRLLKTMQSEAGNMISATGAIHAIRRDLFQQVPMSVCDDFVISTHAIAEGYRLVFSPRAIAYETIAPTDEAEFKRKVRIFLRGLRTVWALKHFFNPFRYGFYAVQIFSHKLLRWSIGWLLIALFGTSVALYRDGAIYQIATLGQAILYASALVALLLKRTPLGSWKILKPLTISYYFCLANGAAIFAWLQLLRGKRVDVWESKRQLVKSREVAIQSD